MNVLCDDEQLYGNEQYPDENWLYLGRYEADRSYKKQVFPLSTIAWIRYLKVVWLSHYDDRYYCTMTRLQVFGSTSIKEFMVYMMK